MEAHQRDLYLYERLGARVLGVSRDDPETLRYFAQDLELKFPLLTNTLGWMGSDYGTYQENKPYFSRRTVVIDKAGVIRFIKDGSPDNQEILKLLVELNKAK